jgi:hypothetical protein
MTERTPTGKRRPPMKRPARRPAPRLGGIAGKGSLATLPWALALLGASAVLAAATVIGR